MKPNNQRIFFLSSIVLMGTVAFLFGVEFRIFGTQFFTTGLHYDIRLDILFASLLVLIGMLIYRVVKNNTGFSFKGLVEKHRNKFLVLTLLLVSGIGTSGGFKANYPRVWNTALFGTKADGVTDDTNGFQNTLTACANAGGGKVYLLNGQYLIGGAIQTSITYGSTTLDANAQIAIPWDTAAAGIVTIEIEGESPASPSNISISSPFSTGTFADMGVTLYSTYTGTRSSTNKGTAIIGSGALTNGFNLNTVNIKNINFKVKNNPNGAGPEIGGFNGKNLIGFNADYCAYYPDTYANNYTLPTREISGFETPETGGGASYRMTNLSVCGLKWGFIFGEHVSGDQISAVECYYGYGIKPGGHASTFERLNTYWCTNGINWYQFGANETSVQVFNIDEYDIEFGVGNTGKYFNTVKTLVDSTNKFQADIHYAVITQGIGLNNASWAITGGSGVNASAIGTTSITKNATGDQGYAFTNTSSTGFSHLQLVGDASQTEILHRNSATSNPNTSEWYTNGVGGILAYVDANGPYVISTNGSERFRISGAGLLTPGATVSQDFGSSSLAWRDIYFSHTIGESAMGSSNSLGTNVTSSTATGSDADFKLVIVTSGNVSGTIADMTFGRTWGTTPNCIIAAANSTTGTKVFAGGGAYIAGTATSSSNFEVTGNITGAGTYTFQCHCGQ